LVNNAGYAIYGSGRNFYWRSPPTIWSNIFGLLGDYTGVPHMRREVNYVSLRLCYLMVQFGIDVVIVEPGLMRTGGDGMIRW
jgi:hypothetical protein